MLTTKALALALAVFLAVICGLSDARSIQASPFRKLSRYDYGGTGRVDSRPGADERGFEYERHGRMRGAGAVRAENIERSQSQFFLTRIFKAHFEASVGWGGSLEGQLENAVYFDSRKSGMRGSDYKVMAQVTVTKSGWAEPPGPYCVSHLEFNGGGSGGRHKLTDEYGTQTFELGLVQDFRESPLALVFSGWWTTLQTSDDEREYSWLKHSSLNVHAHVWVEMA